MLWQYLLLTMAIFCVETRVYRHVRRRHRFMPKYAKHQDNRRNVNHLRIRNEYPLQLQGGEENIQIHGTNVTNTMNFPYMAAVLINGKLWCAGAIVDRNWVLTAAHCLNYVIHVSPSKSLSQYVKVRVGSSKAHDGGTLVDVVGAVRHPRYEIEPVPHADVALMKLADYLEFHKFVNSIKIYEENVEPYAQSFIEVSGWGATRGSDLAFREHSPDMLTARLKVRPQQYCVDSYQLVDGFQFTKDFFCVSLRNSTRDVCLFDAGAPAVQHNQLVGLMSFGPEKCGQSFQPAVFIKAFYFRDFVRDTIADFKSSKEVSRPKKVASNEKSDAEPAEQPEPPSEEPDYGNANIMLISNEAVNNDKR